MTGSQYNYKLRRMLAQIERIEQMIAIAMINEGYLILEI